MSTRRERIEAADGAPKYAMRNHRTLCDALAGDMLDAETCEKLLAIEVGPDGKRRRTFVMKLTARLMRHRTQRANAVAGMMAPKTSRTNKVGPVTVKSRRKLRARMP